jgi:hypothetical protein
MPSDWTQSVMGYKWRRQCEAGLGSCFRKVRSETKTVRPSRTKAIRNSGSRLPVGWGLQWWLKAWAWDSQLSRGPEERALNIPGTSSSSLPIHGHRERFQVVEGRKRKQFVENTSLFSASWKGHACDEKLKAVPGTGEKHTACMHALLIRLHWNVNGGEFIGSLGLKWNHKEFIGSSQGPSDLELSKKYVAC